MQDNSTKLTKKQQAEWVEKISANFKSSKNYTDSSWKPMWDDMSKLYNSERVLVGYNGIADTFVPMAYSTVEAMVSATAGDKPLVEYVPTRPDQATNTEVLNNLFSYYWDLDNWTIKTVQHSRNLFKFGSSVLYFYWNIDHPTMEVIPLKDFFIDPTATFFKYQEARYMGYRFLADKESLKKEKVVDPITGELVPKYMNLDKLSERDPEENDTAKEEDDTMMGSTLDKTAQKDQVEVICYFTLDEKIYVANKEQVIYYGVNDFKQRQQFLGYPNPTGMYPFVFDAFTPTETQLYGQSILQPILKPQELLNDLTNQNVDAASWSLDPEMELDPMYSDYLDKIESATGNVYPFKPGSYQPVQKLPIPSSVFNERTNMKNEIREATAVDEITKGVRLGSDTTATEVKAQVAQSSRRFDLIVGMLENGGYYTMAKLVFQLIQHYVTTPTMFRVVGKDGVDWQTFDPQQFKGDYEPRIKLKATLDSERQLKTRDVKELFTAMVGNPYVDEAALTKYVLKRGFDLDPDEVNDLVKPQDQLMQEAQTQAQGQKQDAKPEDIALAAVGKAYGKGASPDIEAQLEQIAGLQPSVTHSTAMDTHLTDHLNQQHQNIDNMQTAATFPDQMNPMESPQETSAEPANNETAPEQTQDLSNG